MSMLKGYYAFFAIAGGLVLRLAVSGGQMFGIGVLAGNWMLEVVSFALVAAGALALQKSSPWFLRASIVADVLIVLTIVGIPGALPAAVTGAVDIAALVPTLLLGAMLACAAADIMREAGGGTLLEWGVLALWSAGYILWLLLFLPVWSEPVVLLGGRIGVLVLPLGHIALLLDIFRAQQQYIRLEVEKR